MNLKGFYQLMSVVPQTYGEAIVMYPSLQCESHEWDNRTTVENAVYLIRHLTSSLSRRAKDMPDCVDCNIYHKRNEICKGCGKSPAA